NSKPPPKLLGRGLQFFNHFRFHKRFQLSVCFPVILFRRQWNISGYIHGVFIPREVYVRTLQFSVFQLEIDRVDCDVHYSSSPFSSPFFNSSSSCLTFFSSCSFCTASA